MIFKRLFSFTILLLIAVQFQFYSCEEKNNDPILSAPVNEPENTYEVVVEIVSFGGISGCSAAFINKDNQAVADAEVRVNGVEFQNDTTFISSFYADTLNRLSYTYFTSYKLEVKHDGKIIATGKAEMPSPPVIKNIRNPYRHSLNKPLTVKWQKVSKATSIQLVIGSTIYDPVTKDSVEKVFDSGLLSTTKTSLTIPDTMFSAPGEYILGITSFYGLNPGMEIGNLFDQEGYHKGYNLKGAAGIFLTADVYPGPEGIKIIVEQSSALKKDTPTAQPNKNLKELLTKIWWEKVKLLKKSY